MTTRPLSLHTLIRILVALALSPAIGHAADWDIDQLMRDLAQTRSGHARFVERKSIAMLDKPVESSGELLYTAPDHLEKRTFKPKAESMTVDAGTLIIERGRQ
ncbi:MAG: outer membrane lipoprotein carrier protein LolA, partial [Gammaproteobacteria bacterium]|nr:outer membrane lipoprotein carrier protein LolA [Gammaproteobacteria bacterium]